MLERDLRKQKLEKLTLFSVLTAIQLLLFFTPLGFLPIGALSLTTLHLPVIIASVILGPVYGLTSGFIFGLLSFLRNTFAPGLTSFVFSPFISYGIIRGNFWSLVICFVPRMLLGLIPAALLKLFNLRNKRRYSKSWKVAIVAFAATFAHTFLVLSGIFLFFGDAYASVLNKTKDAIFVLLGTTIFTNGVLEAFLAAFVLFAFTKIYYEYLRKEDNYG